MPPDLLTQVVIGECVEHASVEPRLIETIPETRTTFTSEATQDLLTNCLGLASVSSHSSHLVVEDLFPLVVQLEGEAVSSCSPTS